MKNIRIGNDIHVRWRLMRGGEPEDFGSKEVAVALTDAVGREACIDWSVTEGGWVEVTFRGRAQMYPGVYTLTLTENRGKDDMVTVDRQNVFRLVTHQDSVISGGGQNGCHCDMSIETVDVTSELRIPSFGKGVIHVYNIARSTWDNGLQSDGETVRVKVAKDSADVLSVDGDGLHINKDAIGNGGFAIATPEDIAEIISSVQSGEKKGV